jgi:hypothetical protein
LNAPNICGLIRYRQVSIDCAFHEAVRAKKKLAPPHRSVLRQDHRHGSRRELRLYGAGNDRARQRQPNENAAEDRSGDKETYGPHDGTPHTTHALN